MHVNSSLHSQTHTLLENLANANKQTHWVLANCQVVPKTFLTRLFFYTIAYLFPCTKSWMGINLKQSRQRLKKIGKEEINKKHLAQLLLFNRAVYQFISIAPRHPLPQLRTQILKDLIATAIKKPVNTMPQDRLYDPKPCCQQEIDEFLEAISENHLSDLAIEWIGEFEKSGGRVVILPRISFTETWNYCLGIKDQDLFPICHAGLVRSQILRLIAQNLFSDKQLKVHLAHGMTGGYDPSTRSSMYTRPFYESEFRSLFAHAFGIIRDYRFGQAEEVKALQGIKIYQDMRKFFAENYYTHHPSQNKKVYLAFWDTGLSAIYNLWLVNVQDKLNVGQCPSALHGVTVVLIPEKDWISCAQPISKVIDEIWQQYQQTHSASLPVSQECSPSIRREILWWAIGLNPLPADWKEKLQMLLPEIFQKLSERSKGKTHKGWIKDELGQFFLLEACRAAFWRFSTLFQPLK
jgi:hypothetical protein